ncbi:transcription initiation protein [Bryobacterales bacterium F-183]|nr:transcription initiation protein [Bryobacterales bacterium F-183]
MPQYLLLLHEEPQVFADKSPAELQAIFERYIAWAGKLAQEGKLVGANKLEDRSGKSLRQVNGKLTVTDGPYTEGREVIGGYFLIEASSYEDAVSIGSECPHADFGVIEIRQVEPTGGDK